ncbi:MAG: hypothetical protein RI906_3339 [Pseudomonadota bacterium]|jgi:hypothetical protein
MRKLTEIIIHCAAVRPDWMSDQTTFAKVSEIRKWHVKDRGWSDIGYHFIIDRDGTVAEGREMEKDGAHVQGRNKGTVGVCLIGGHGSNATDKFADHYTPEQDNALRKLLDDLQAKHPSISKVSGHNDYTSAKACPGFKVSEWITGTPKSVAKSTTVQASAFQMVSGAGAGIAALGALDGMAQIIALVFSGAVLLTAAWIFRERIRHWAEGVR